MTIRIQQISDYGTSNPIVARLSIQTRELLPFFDLNDHKRDEIWGLYFSKLQPKLISCCRIEEKLAEEVRSHQKQIDDCGLPMQENANAYTIPAILDLEHRVETFLYTAKSVLRDLTHIFLVLFGKDFGNKAHFDKVLKWAKNNYGNEDEFVRMLGKDHKWIMRIVEMRNAIEHPGGRSGFLNIDNFTSIENEQKILVIEPRWSLNDDKKISIIQEMEVMVSDLLTFCEDTFVLNIERFKKPFPINIVEVPDAERDPVCPVRFKIVIDNKIIPTKL